MSQEKKCSQAGIDDAESECGLDEWKDWNVKIDNGGVEERLREGVEEVVREVERKRVEVTALKGERVFFTILLFFLGS